MLAELLIISWSLKYICILFILERFKWGILEVLYLLLLHTIFDILVAWCHKLKGCRVSLLYVFVELELETLVETCCTEGSLKSLVA
jgi:hypothetical protein